MTKGRDVGYADDGYGEFEPVQQLSDADIAALGEKPSDQGHRSGVKWRLVAVVLGVLVMAALVVSFFAMRAHYSGKTAPGVSIGSTSLAGQSGDQVEDTVKHQVASSYVKVSDGSTSIKASLKDLGVSVDVKQTSRRALDAKTGNIFVRLNPLSKCKVEPKVNVDTYTLSSYVNGAFVPDSEQAHPSSISFDGSKGMFLVHEGNAGRSVDTKPVERSVQNVLSDLGSHSEARVSYHTDNMPISVEAATQAATQANVRLGNQFVVDNGNGTAFKIPGPQVAAWIKPEADFDKNVINLTYDKAAIGDYMNTTLPKRLNRSMVSQVDVVEDDTNTMLGTTTQGVDGVTIKDVDSVSKQMVSALTNAQPMNVTVPADVTKFDVQQRKTHYRIVVDRAAQMVNVYHGSDTVRSFPVCTGKNGDKETTNGDYFIYLTYKVQDMRGRDYFSPGVKWVSYFNGGQGFHTADWNHVGIDSGNPAGYGSHGCVNMNEADAKWIYDNCPKGTFVQVVGDQPAGAVR